MRRAAVLGLCAASFGCSVVNPVSDHEVVPVHADRFCDVLTDVVCTGVAGCCPSASISPEQCEEFYSVFCANIYGRLIADERTGYDAVEAGYQLALMRQRADACDPALAESLVSMEGVLSALSGSVDLGGSCEPVFMERPDEMVFDTPRFFACTEGSYCGVGAAGEWQCLPPAPPGGRCSGSVRACVDGGLCVRVSEHESRCMNRFPAGAACENDSNCESWVCGNCVGEACTCVASDDAEPVYCELVR